MVNNPPHNALRATVNKAIANGSPIITEKPTRYIVETQRRDGSWTNSIHAPIHEHFEAAQALADQMSANESPLNPSRVSVYDPARHVTFTNTDALLKHCRR